MIEAWRAAVWLFIAALACWYCALVVLAQVDNFAAAHRAASVIDKLGAIMMAGAAVAALIELLK